MICQIEGGEGFVRLREERVFILSDRGRGGFLFCQNKGGEGFCQIEGGEVFVRMREKRVFVLSE